MSIYATVGKISVWPSVLKNSRVDVWIQSVPWFIGSPSEYPEGDPYGDFLPPPVDNDKYCRAVVFVADKTEKDCQRYVDPLLVLTGEEYANMTFEVLHCKLVEAATHAPSGGEK